MEAGYLGRGGGGGGSVGDCDDQAEFKEAKGSGQSRG